MIKKIMTTKSTRVDSPPYAWHIYLIFHVYSAEQFDTKQINHLVPTQQEKFQKSIHSVGSVMGQQVIQQCVLLQ